ncbi:YitT family protein [Ovoidimarina sediminis]|uniref:YitT family protein n=1 Tax=Ovoidimarina sediminis TaxID=3079856 RepID=UPI00290A4A38|nr:YitT family protein [Rhodophyticola sp. MJ-SS7]MDU8945583.1 YitT family protein [Rhodophyticola sp. MJ-SS7]
MAEPHKPLEHTLFEDAMAFVLGTAMCALGVVFLTHLGLVTGQTAGLGVLLAYVTGLPFGGVFFLVNLPFYILAWLRLGPRFTVKSFIAVAMVSVFTEAFGRLVELGQVNTPLGAALAGGMIGLGLIVIFRHGASLGGIGVLALYLQERIGFQAGWTQLIFDVALFAAALFVLDLPLVIWSLLGAVVVNLIIGVNHRKDRYIGR